MHRKILGICAALVALAAFAIVPAMAAASPALTDAGVLAPTGTKVVATGEETSKFTSGFVSVECSKSALTGTLTSNTGSNIQTTVESATFENEKEVDCSSNLGATRVTVPGLTNEGGTEHWCIVANSETGADKGQVRPRACTASTGGAFKFTLDITNAPFLGTVICKYTRSANLTGSFVTNASPATLKLEGEPVFNLEAGSSGSCSSEGKLVKLNTTLETDETNNPFTIS